MNKYEERNDIMKRIMKLKSKLKEVEFIQETNITREQLNHFLFGDKKEKPLLVPNEDWHWQGGERIFKRTSVSKVKEKICIEKI